LYQWVDRRGKRIAYERYYEEYLLGRSTLSVIANKLSISIPTLRKYFDDIAFSFVIAPAPPQAINLLIDATFFGRKYGYLCFHDTKRIIYFEEIKTESIAAFRACIYKLSEAGFQFASFTLDGKRGFILTLKSMFPNTPIQMCHFHQKAIIRRYITNNPKTECGRKLKQLMTRLSKGEPQDFIDAFFALKEEYAGFMAEKNEQEKYVHGRLRAAFRSIKTNLPYLFVYKEVENGIPHTTNQLEGIFSHLKEKIQIHRGLSEPRKKSAIKFLLKNA
jgi:hypothetical protein